MQWEKLFEMAVFPLKMGKVWLIPIKEQAISLPLLPTVPKGKYGPATHTTGTVGWTAVIPAILINLLKYYCVRQSSESSLTP